MKTYKLALTSFAIIAFVMALQASACAAEERFGPWVYYSPYYFPPDNCCLGRFLTPADYAPRYESPTPPKPSYGGDCCFPNMPVPPPPQMARRARRGAHFVPPRAVSSAPPRGQTNPSQFRSSLKPVGQPQGVVSTGPRPVDHPGPQQRILAPQRNINRAR